jgi:hypothetical protein
MSRRRPKLWPVRWPIPVKPREVWLRLWVIQEERCPDRWEIWGASKVRIDVHISSGRGVDCLSRTLKLLDAALDVEELDGIVERYVERGGS